MNNTRKRSKNFQSAFHAAEAMSHDLALQRGKKTPVFEQSGVEGLLSSKDIAAQIKLLKSLMSMVTFKESSPLQNPRKDRAALKSSVNLAQKSFLRSQKGRFIWQKVSSKSEVSPGGWVL